MSELILKGLSGFPMVEPKDNLSELIIDAMKANNISLLNGDVLVIAQKIISKAEDRYVFLNDVIVSTAAEALSKKSDKDPRLVQLILNESKEMVRQRAGLMIVEHNLGYVHANAGIDQSNIDSDKDNPKVLLLPLNADKSASLIKGLIKQHYGVDIAVIINDSAGRAWRNGIVGMAIGTAGFEPVIDMVGEIDLCGRPLQVTQVAIADELAAAASFIMGQGAEGIPLVHIRGAKLKKSDGGSRRLIRDKSQDLFR